MSLYNDYRPQDFDQMFGNEAELESLAQLFHSDAQQRPPQAFLFCGPSGCGKTTAARIVKDKLKCSDMDCREINAADFRGIDTVREIIAQMRLRPMEGPARVWLIDECHQLSRDAQSALLKALEDTPAHVTFILATTDPEKLLPTIKTRCATYEFKPLMDSEMESLLDGVVEGEKKQLDDKARSIIVRDSMGSPRMALVILEKVLSLPMAKQAAAAEVQAAKENKCIDLCRLLIKKAPWAEVAACLKGLEKEDAEQIRHGVLGYAQSVLLNQKDIKSPVASRAFVVIDAFRESIFYTKRPGLTAACFSTLIP